MGTDSQPTQNAQHQLTIKITYEDGSNADYHGNVTKTCMLTATVDFPTQE